MSKSFIYKRFLERGFMHKKFAFSSGDGFVINASGRWLNILQM